MRPRFLSEFGEIFGEVPMQENDQLSGFCFKEKEFRKIESLSVFSAVHSAR